VSKQNDDDDDDTHAVAFLALKKVGVLFGPT